jgi:hypothetical protein
MGTRTCTHCRVTEELNSVYFYKRCNIRKGVVKVYFDNRCKKCVNEITGKKRVEIRSIIKPAIGRHYVKQAIIGSKTEPYYLGEDFDYQPPTYGQILSEYSF